MLIKKVIAECLAAMGEKDFTDSTERTEQQTELATRLLVALNRAYREAVTEYLPVVEEETVNVTDGVIDVSSLAKNIVYPVSLTADGKTYKLKIYPDKLLSDYSGRAVLRYAYMPDELAESSELADMRFTLSMLTDGTLAEYYFRERAFDLAESYDTSFRTALSVARYRGRELRLKGGRW